MTERNICYQPQGEHLTNGDDPTCQPSFTSRFHTLLRPVRLLKCMDTCTLGIISLSDVERIPLP